MTLARYRNADGFSAPWNGCCAQCFGTQIIACAYCEDSSEDCEVCEGDGHFKCWDCSEDDNG